MQLINKLWKESKPTKLLLVITPVLFLVINAILKYSNLASQSIAIDEPWSIYYSQFDVSVIIERLSRDNNPPLFEIILHYWIKLFGIEASAIRALPATFSIITSYWIYIFGKRFFSFKTGVIAAILFTLSNFNNFYAHDTRVYTLLNLLAVVNMYYFVSLLKSPKNLKYIILFFLSQVLIMYAHFYGLFLIVVQVISVLFISDIRKAIGKKFFLVLSGSTLLFSSWIYVIVKRFLFLSSTGTWIPPIKNTGIIADVYNESFNGTQTNYVILSIIAAIVCITFLSKKISNLPIRYLLTTYTLFVTYHLISLIIGEIPTIGISLIVESILVVALILLLLTLALTSKKIQLVHKVLLIWLIAPVILAFLASLYTPMFIDRYLIYTSSALYLLLGTLILNKKVISYILITASVLALFFSVDYDIHNGRNIKPMVEKVKELETDDTAIIIYPAWFDLTFTYHYDIAIFKETNPENLDNHIASILKTKNIHAVWGEHFDSKNEILNSSQIILVDYSFGSNSYDEINAFYSSHIPNHKTIDYGSVKLHIFNKQE